MSGNRCLGLGEVAEVLGVSLALVRRLVAKRLIAVTHIGARVKVQARDLDAFLERSRLGSLFE